MSKGVHEEPAEAATPGSEVDGVVRHNIQTLIADVEPWDPFPFVMLAMIASVEAIFLSTR